ncbi:MAG: asparagine synthase (glutamine-hydrolyzing) [Proteobacteria bacterium]|nr:asparagine synthase (glutamine-hydrolyzing) [Pseudomonadota bacterium]
MCGIAGLFALSGRLDADPGLIDTMCERIMHRGPDDRGVLRHPIGHIGMQRLSIIDIATGHQPIHNEDRTVWIVFNGEIYNFRDLRLELEAAGHVFYTHTDTECIVHGYEQWGEAVFEHLRGMFGVALLDLNQRKLVLARDRLGKKPLYYTTLADGTLAFGSELKCLTVVPGFRAKVNTQATHDYFAFGYVPAPASIYEGVYKLPPAHVLVAQGGHTRMHRYWQPQFAPKWTDDEATLQNRLLQELEDAVRVRLVSDVPFGAFLSGGLDSSVVAALMARNMRQPVKTFSIGFREERFNELPAARAVAAHIGAEHTELIVEADAVASLDDLVWSFDEPFGDSSAIPTHLVSRLAAGHVKMVLSGDGGDELFAGYDRYAKYQRLARLRTASLGLAVPILRASSVLALGARGKRLSRIADRMALPFPDDYISGVALATRGDLDAILAPDFHRADPYASIRGHFIRAGITEPLEQILDGDMATYLSDDILVKVDRMTMANSLEARAPLLDQNLLEFAARLPFDLKFRGGRGKYLFRRVAEKLLPTSVLNKPKQGFAIPIAKWLRHELRQRMLDTFASRSFAERGVFDVAGVKRVMDQHMAATHDHSELLWLILTYETWARRFLDTSRPLAAHAAPPLPATMAA